MKNLFITLVLLISFVAFLGNDAKADTTYVDLDTIVDYQVLTFCNTDTVYLYNSAIPNPDLWRVPDDSPYNSHAIIATESNIKYSDDNGSTWNSSIENTNGTWQLAHDCITDFFKIYFTDPVTEPWPTNNLAICGSEDTLYTENYQEGLYYTWEEVGVGIVTEGYYPNDTSYIVDHTCQMKLTITGGCNEVIDTIDMVITTTVLPDLGPDQTFCGTTVNCDLFVTENYDSFLWSTGSTDSIITVNSTGIQWVEVENACIGIVRDSIEIFQHYYPNLDIGPDITTICQTSSISFSTGFEYDVIGWSYSWGGTMFSTDTSITITPSQDTTVYVFAGQGSCPLLQDSIRIILATPYDQNALCVVTVDTSGFNKIIWGRTFGEGIASYNIYRLNINYDLIGNVSIGDEPIFYDLGADPMTSAHRYKITAVDTCGNESVVSFYHGTIHITSSPASGGGIDLTITDQYLDESGIYSPSIYYIMIDSLNDGNFVVIDSMSAVFNSYHIANPVTGAVYVMSVALPWNCDGTKSLGSISMSNRSSIVTGIETKITPEIKIYPNPSNGIFHIDGNINHIKVMSITEQIVLQTESKNQIDLSGYPKGIYILYLETAYGPSVKKITLQ